MGEILVVPRKKLFEQSYFQGYVDDERNNYFEKIKLNREWRPREEMEHDPSFKQPIAYALITNIMEKKVFSYVRSKKDSDYGEKRLQGKWSWGIGGHIDFSDAAVIEAKDPIEFSLSREIFEETGIEIIVPKLLGYINDDSNDVGKVHFGLLYLIETDRKEANPNDPEITNGKFRGIEELEQIINSGENVEEWSKIAIKPLKNYLDIYQNIVEKHKNERISRNR